MLQSTGLGQRYLSGLLAIVPAGLTIFGSNGALLLAFPFLLTGGAVAGGFWQRWQVPRQHRRATDHAGWIMVQAVAWTTLLSLEFVSVFLTGIHSIPLTWHLFIHALAFSFRWGSVVGLLASGLQLGIATSPIDRKARWLLVGTFSWLLTAQLLGLVLIGFMQTNYSYLAWLLVIFIGVPTLWVIQSVITDWALQPRPSLQ